MSCATLESPGTFLLPKAEQTLYQTLSVASLILGVFNLSLYILPTHFRCRPRFRLSPQRQGRRGWLLLLLSLGFVGQACSDVYHAHLSPCYPALRLWPDYVSIRLAFQAPVGGLGALIQLERCSSICLKSTRIREGLWRAGLVLFFIITPMNVVFTVMDAEQHKWQAEYWPQYQGLDWLYSVNFVFPIVGVVATVWTTRVAFSSMRIKGLKTPSESSSGPGSRASLDTAEGVPVGEHSQKESHPVGHGGKYQGHSLAPLSTKCLSLRLLHPPPHPSPATPDPSSTSPVQRSIQTTFKFLSIMSILSWIVGSAMVLGASHLSPAPRFCVAAMSGFPGLTVEILFKRLIRLRSSRRRRGDPRGNESVLPRRALSLGPPPRGNQYDLESKFDDGGEAIGVQSNLVMVEDRPEPLAAIETHSNHVTIQSI